MPRFQAFRALRYSSSDVLEDVCAPPYDVLSDEERLALASKHPNNIVHVDLPIGSDPYVNAADTLAQWITTGVLEGDNAPSLTIYRMAFTDSIGVQRQTVGVIGELEVVDEGAGGVLPHEQTTPKAKTDRLDLTRATDTNLSPVWGLSLSADLSDALAEHGEPRGSLRDSNGVIHSVERITDPKRIAAITNRVSRHEVVIADGHHRYAIARTFRDEVRARTNRNDTGAELTLAYVNELVDEQLSVAAIHRLYKAISTSELRAQLAKCFDTTGAGPLNVNTLSEMKRRGSLCLALPSGETEWLTPKPSTFVGVRNLDSAMLEHAMSGAVHTVHYQHSVTEVVAQLATREFTGAVLIKPVSVAEIRRTATEGLLMPPKSTFFTPKLQTGLVLRPLNTH